MASDLLYLLCVTRRDSRFVSGLNQSLRTTGNVFLAFLVIFSALPVTTSGQGYQGYGAFRPRQAPREQGGGGLAFLMDNWLFRQPPPPTGTTGNVDLDAITDGTESLPNYGLNSDGFTSSLEDPPDLTSSPPWSTKVEIPSQEATKSTADVAGNIPTSVQRTRATQASETTSAERNAASRRGKEAREKKEKEPSDGDIKLEGGDVEGTGNVLIYRNGVWGAVCDDGWNLHSAHVVCRQLGHPHALGQTMQAYFGAPKQGLMLDNVQCFGDEKSLTDCQSSAWGVHDCDIREAAGVFCAPKDLLVSTTQAPTIVTSPEATRPARHRVSRAPPYRRRVNRHRKARNGTSTNTLRKKGLQALHAAELQADENTINVPPAYKMRVLGGRNAKEGRLEVRVGGRWGAVCADPWTLREATVACRHLGLGYAQMAVVGTAFGGSRLDKVLNGIKCEGHEEHLYECYHEEVGKDVICDDEILIAGVICTNLLPDLVPNATMLEVSTYLDDVPMYYLTCAMEEGCAAPSAYRIKQRYSDWSQQRRRLMRFSSSTWNFGTADFRPFINKELWEWHQCHMHYHSMEVFATYDILDHHGNKKADGHKASFCLEDVECMSGASKRYECVGYSDQGISVGCADNYLHNIDCQWIDITDLPTGNYIFKIHVNPERMVPELSFLNNAATCKLEYNGYEVYVDDCVVGEG